MPKKSFRPDAIAEVHLDLIRDDEAYLKKMFALVLTDEDENELRVMLDGIMVGDICADARDAGLPVGWDSPDGVPRIKMPDGSWATARVAAEIERENAEKKMGKGK